MSENAFRDAVYLDSNVFIVGVEGEPLAAAPVQRLFGGLRGFARPAVTSELTLAEILAPATRSDVLPFEMRIEAYTDLIIENDLISLQSVSREILLDTIAIRESIRQKLPDSIHIATALRTGCTHFASFDKDARKLPAPLKLLVPTSDVVERYLDMLGA